MEVLLVLNRLVFYYNAKMWKFLPILQILYLRTQIKLCDWEYLICFLLERSKKDLCPIWAQVPTWYIRLWKHAMCVQKTSPGGASAWACGLLQYSHRLIRSTQSNPKTKARRFLGKKTPCFCLELNIRRKRHASGTRTRLRSYPWPSAHPWAGTRPWPFAHSRAARWADCSDALHGRSQCFAHQRTQRAGT